MEVRRLHQISSFGWARIHSCESCHFPSLCSVVESFEILPVIRPVADTYARIARTLRQQGLLIGSNDLWIGATAVQRDWPLVTRNLDQFSRIPGIRLMGY